MQAKHFVNSAVFPHSLNLRDSACKLQHIARWIWMLFLSKDAPTTPSKWNNEIKNVNIWTHFNPATGKGTLVNQHNASLLQLCYLFLPSLFCSSCLVLFWCLTRQLVHKHVGKPRLGHKGVLLRFGRAWNTSEIRWQSINHQNSSKKSHSFDIQDRNVQDTVVGKKIFAIFSGHD